MRINRRQMIRQSALGLGALMAVGAAAAEPTPSPVCPEPTPQPQIFSDIARNHGHAVNLSLKEFLQGLRAAQTTPILILDITGQSGHGHTLELNQAALQAILLGETLELQSTAGAGHTHITSLRLILPEEENA